MSHVTNLLLSFSIMEELVEGWDSDDFTLMASINTWMTAQGYGAFSPDVGQVAGGGHKNLEVPLYIAAFNYFHLDEFLGMLCTLPWVEPACVQVFVQEEDDDIFRVITPIGISTH